jgi:hypothetical protein
MSKHTEGPWTVRTFYREGMDGARYYIDGADGATFADICGVDPREDRANARLIAAAPDLLACVQNVLDAGDDNADAREICDYIDWTALRAAIAKAEGGQQ